MIMFNSCVVGGKTVKHNDVVVQEDTLTTNNEAVIADSIVIKDTNLGNFKISDEEYAEFLKAVEQLQELDSIVYVTPNEDVGVDEVITYLVVPGDNLWSIAYRYYSDPYKWKDIYRNNADTIGDNPRFIFPEQYLKLYPPFKRIGE